MPLSVKDLSIDLAVRYGFQVMGAVVILIAGALVARWIGRLAEEWLERRHTEPPIRTLAVRVVRVVVLLFALVVALDKFGFQVAPLVAGIGVAGIGIGIALQGVLSNVVAGLTIILTKPFRVGEHIALLGVYGDVSRIELFSTTLAHPDRSRVVIPNRKIVGEILHNFGTVRQLPLTVHVAYRSDPATAVALAREVLAADPRVLREPEPVVGISALAESGIAVAVKPWVAVADFEGARAEIYEALVAGLRARSIDVAVPRREVRLESAA